MRKKWDIHVKRSSLFFFFLYLEGLLGLFAGQQVLPDKYFNDSRTIWRFMFSDQSLGFFDSYANTARFFNVIGLRFVDSPLFQGLICYTIAFFCLHSIYKLVKVPVSKGIFVFLLIWNVPFVIYMGQLSKDLIVVMILALQLHLIHRKRKGHVFSVIVLTALYALFFRHYWIIILYISAIFFLMITKDFNLLGIKFQRTRILFGKYFMKLSRPIKYSLLIFGIIVLQFAAYLNSIYLTDARTRVNLARLGDPEAVTLINNLLPNQSVFTDLVNWISGWLRLLIPVEVMRHGGLQHVAFSILHIVTISAFLLMVRFLKKSGQGNRAVDWSIAWLISFSFVQGIFEPDFGSYLKHETALLPMFLYLMLSYRGMRLERFRRIKNAEGVSK